MKPHTVPVLRLLGEAKTMIVAFFELNLGKFGRTVLLRLDLYNLERSKNGGRNRKGHGFISALLCLSLSRLQVDTVVPIHAAPAGEPHTHARTHSALPETKCVE